MKKGNQNIIFTWIVLICFIAGQVMVFAHQHHVRYTTHQIAQDQQTLTEKCQLCDTMHHNSMDITYHQYFTPAVSADHFYKKGTYNFISIALILSAGRSPPLS